jgi:carbonic anhydrase
MGHTECGAVKGRDRRSKALATSRICSQDPAGGGFRGGARSSKDSADVDKIAEANVRLSMREHREKSPVMKELIDSGKMGLAGAMYDVKTGEGDVPRD